MPMQQLRTYLDDNNVEYVLLSHSKAYTAQRIAAAAHVPGKEMAKSVMLKVDGQLMMAVLRAPDKVSLTKVRDELGAENVELAREPEFEGKFPDCELGAMPPFGNLYDLPVVVDKKLADDEEIVFNACSHRELIRMPYADFAKLVKPQLGSITIQE